MPSLKKNNLPLNAGRALCFPWSKILPPIPARLLVPGCSPNESIRYMTCHLCRQSLFRLGFLDTPLGSVNRDLTDRSSVVSFVKKSLNPILCWQVSLLIAAKRCCRCRRNVADSGSSLNGKFISKLCARCRRKAPALWNLLYRQINACRVYNQRARSCRVVICGCKRKESVSEGR